MPLPADAERLHAIERWTLALGAALTLGTFLCFGRELGLAVSIGAGLMALNAIAMRRVGERIWRLMQHDAQTQGSKKPSAARAVVLFNLKMAALLAAVYFVVRQLHVHPIGLVIGLSVYPLAAVAVALTYVRPEDRNG
jgi:hypothetical protein